MIYPISSENQNALFNICYLHYPSVQRNSKKYISKEEALKKLQAYCAYQDRCHQEVRKKLLDLGIYGDDLEEIVADLIVDKFLDEERFARSYARGKFRHKNWGRVKIRQQLKMKRISTYCLKKAMEEIDEEEYQMTLEMILLKKRKLIKANDTFHEKGKLANYLINKGYESSLVWETIHRLVQVED